MIRADLVEEFPFHIMNQFAGCGAASKAFERVATAFFARVKRPFEYESRECRKICATIPHFDCVPCGAVVWDVEGWWSEGDTIRCASCGAKTVWNPKV
jgi:DNA-directed RNA polymerase subunit RPC12/RpoP